MKTQTTAGSILKTVVIVTASVMGLLIVLFVLGLIALAQSGI